MLIVTNTSKWTNVIRTKCMANVSICSRLKGKRSSKSHEADVDGSLGRPSLRWLTHGLSLFISLWLFFYPMTTVFSVHFFLAISFFPIKMSLMFFFWKKKWFWCIFLFGVKMSDVYNNKTLGIYTPIFDNVYLSFSLNRQMSLSKYKT